MKNFSFTFNSCSYHFNGKRLYCDGRSMDKFTVAYLIEQVDVWTNMTIICDVFSYSEVIEQLVLALGRKKIVVSGLLSILD